MNTRHYIPNHTAHYNNNTLLIKAKFLETKILDLKIPFNCEIQVRQTLDTTNPRQPNTRHDKP